ncbi:GNAT family N-acetyltransferase [Cellulosilyticum sp. I15G10I2]|uniref:GNAT family N-acetyltransferase n=1 Tax=Cellulosilyticum sp. I15G10I2 TaxID=1892843 RepID=UPI00085C0677|nr:GNAT family N-acetyltransferase [Cellulosilyticum sp. I15G10I2]
MDSDGDIILKDMENQDCELIAEVFSQEGYSKPISLYQSYFKQQELGLRDIIIAYYQNQIVGYITIIWESHYEDFKERGIPEIKDIRVLSGFRKRGIATQLINEAEKRAARVASYCAAGVGLAESYEAAQCLYAKRDYIPNGKGVFYMDQDIQNDQLEVDDNQALMMIKAL